MEEVSEEACQIIGGLSRHVVEIYSMTDAMHDCYEEQKPYIETNN